MDYSSFLEKLYIDKMTISSPFYVNLPSNTVHPSRENKTNSFYVNLPSILRLKGEWEVGVVEVNIPISWYNIPEIPERNRTIIIERNFFKFKDNVLVAKSANDILPDKRFLIERIPYGNYNSIKDLIEAINSVLQKIDIYPNDVFFKKERKPHIKIESQNLKPILKVGRGDTVTFSSYLCSLLRLDLHEKAEKKEGNAVSFTGPPLEEFEEYENLMAKNLLGTTQYENFTAGGVPNLHYTSSNIYIYSNIVSNEVVGNQQVPLLRTIRCTGTFGSDIKEVFVTPYYKKLKRNEIHEIEITICDDVGEPVKFEYGTVFLVLHFRPIVK